MLEMAVVISVAGILAATVVPALNSLEGVREASAAEEVERRVVLARGHALSRGRPTGIQIDPAARTIRMWEIVSVGAAPTPARTPLNEVEPALRLDDVYPGVTIASVVGGTGATGAQTFWFGIDGTPQTRNAAGALGAAWTRDAAITMSGGQLVYIRRGSGAVER